MVDFSVRNGDFPSLVYQMVCSNFQAFPLLKTPLESRGASGDFSWDGEQTPKDGDEMDALRQDPAVISGKYHWEIRPNNGIKSVPAS